MEEYARDQKCAVPQPNPWKRYFKQRHLADIVQQYPVRESAATGEAERQKERELRLCFTHFLSGLLQVRVAVAMRFVVPSPLSLSRCFTDTPNLQIDPQKRWNPMQV